MFLNIVIPVELHLPIIYQKKIHLLKYFTLSFEFRAHSYYLSYTYLKQASKALIYQNSE